LRNPERPAQNAPAMRKLYDIGGLRLDAEACVLQISSIRRALACVPGGEGWIETLARRGYRFVGPVVAIAGAHVATSSPIDRRCTNLPCARMVLRGLADRARAR